MGSVNNNFTSDYQNLVHRNTTNIIQKKAEQEPVPTSQEHIYTYATDKDKRKTPVTPGKKYFKIVCIVLLLVGLYLLLFSIFLMIRGGFSLADLNDINANCRYAMIILSFFVIFIAFTGYSGAYTNWKPIILTFSVLASMALLGHLYVAKKLLDATRFTQRDMAISWWDVYTDPIRAKFQDKFECCGFLSYVDLPVPSMFCPSNEVDVVTSYGSDAKEGAEVKKFDSYQKRFPTTDIVKDDKAVDNGAVADANPAPNQQVQNDPPQPQDNTQDQQAPAPAPAQDQDQAQPAAQPAAVKAGGGNNAAAANKPNAAANKPNAAANKPNEAAGNANKAPAENPVQAPNAGGAAPAGNAGGAGNAGNAGNAGDDGKPGLFDNIFNKRQESQEQLQEIELSISEKPGCKEYIVPLVKRRLSIMYIINYSLCLVYVIAIGLSLYYWQYMRKEKEFDEFA